MKNKLSDLNNHLFAQLERLGDEDLIKDEAVLGKEIKRTKALTDVAREIIQNSRTVLEAQKAFGGQNTKMPDMLGIDKQ